MKSDLPLTLRHRLQVALTEIGRLQQLLVEANNAFDECTGDYPKELVQDEPWREFRSEQ